MRKKTSDKSIPSGVAVNIGTGCDIIRFDRRKIIEMTRKVARRFGVRKAQINFIVLDDGRITRLNRKFLKRGNPTDVISFDLSDEAGGVRIFDIAVNAQMAQREATSRGRKPQSELALYFVHGLLHNLGFDDSTAGAAARMHRAEDSILKEFGYGIVYK